MACERKGFEPIIMPPTPKSTLTKTITPPPGPSHPSHVNQTGLSPPPPPELCVTCQPLRAKREGKKLISLVIVSVKRFSTQEVSPLPKPQCNNPVLDPGQDGSSSEVDLK